MAQKYHEILNNPEIISWAKLHLKKSDRIVWYLKEVKKDPQIHPSETLQHFYSMNIPVIEEFQIPKDVMYFEVCRQLKLLETKYFESLEQEVSVIPECATDEVILDLGEYQWVNLHKSFCEREGKAMQHCGNQGDPEGTTILSLREKVVKGGKNFWRPHLTFILNLHYGALTEMKGKQNNKPAAKYHPYILPLLRLPLINKIVGGGYLPKNNFHLSDLPRESQVSLLTEFPEKISEQELDLALSGGKAEVLNRFDFESFYFWYNWLSVISWVKDPEELRKLSLTNKNMKVLEYISILDLTPDDVKYELYNKYDRCKIGETVASIKSDSIREKIFFENLGKTKGLWSWVTGQKSDFIIKNLPSLTYNERIYEVAVGEISDETVLSSIFYDDSAPTTVRRAALRRLFVDKNSVNLLNQIMTPELSLSAYKVIFLYLNHLPEVIKKRLSELNKIFSPEKAIFLNIMILRASVQHVQYDLQWHPENLKLYDHPLVNILQTWAFTIHQFKKKGIKSKTGVEGFYVYRKLLKMINCLLHDPTLPPEFIEALSYFIADYQSLCDIRENVPESTAKIMNSLEVVSCFFKTDVFYPFIQVLEKDGRIRRSPVIMQNQDFYVEYSNLKKAT